MGHIKSGRGISMYIKNSISYDDTRFKHLNVSERNLEIQFVVITGRNAKEMTIVNCYRPPNGSIDLAENTTG